MSDAEINESVARKLGWKPSYPHENGCQFCEETSGHHHEWGSFGQRSILEHIPDYCHSIAAAWEIVEHVDYCKIVKAANAFRCEMVEVKEYADTAPMAICRAFLNLPL